jgi:hypothetical protein
MTPFVTDTSTGRALRLVKNCDEEERDGDGG